MNKSEAIAEMLKGNKVNHRYFSNNEWMTMIDGKIVFEDDVKCDPDDFWRWRISDTWNDGYYIFNDECIFQPDIYLYNDIKEEHPKDAYCYDGFAWILPSGEEQDSPSRVKFIYPKLADLNDEQKKKVTDNRPTDGNIRFDDVFMLYGSIKIN